MTVEEMLLTMDYKDVITNFTKISKVPRGSSNNKGISDFLVNFAIEKGLKYVQDEALNVIIYKEATPFYESHPTIILQGHMDMVCVKEASCFHDFKTEGLELLVEDDYMFANGTSLGGDDGIALAYAMSLLSDTTIEHPAIEVVITTDEETGMEGAKALNASLLNGKMMINIDSENEDVVLVSCAGGLTLHALLPLKRVCTHGLPLKIVLNDLRGGHSGVMIHNNRTNAINLMSRLLFDLKNEMRVQLIYMKGGEKDNAIPSFSEAAIIVGDGNEEDSKTAEKIIHDLYLKYKNELTASEPFFTIDAQGWKRGDYETLHPGSFERVLSCLIHTPNGVQVMSSHIEGLVESSLNIGIFYTEEERAIFHYSIRSSISSYKYFLKDKITYLFELFGGETEVCSEYPAWEYKEKSILREKFSDLYQKEYGKSPKFEAIHAGLECGIICEKVPEMDIISIGPMMKDIHSPKERLSISSSIRLYKFLEKLLMTL